MHRRNHTVVDPRLESTLRRLVIWGALAVLLLPAARGHNDWFGWMPLWLLGMPLSAWWALHRFALPQRAQPQAVPLRRRRRGNVQARRFASASLAGRLSRAA
jgi:hypothetical protein